jgi:hypothetical protein
VRGEPRDLCLDRLRQSPAHLAAEFVCDHPTRGFLDLLAEGGVSFDAAAAQQQAATAAHNQHETRLFAASMGRTALAKLEAS